MEAGARTRRLVLAAWRTGGLVEALSLAELALGAYVANRSELSSRDDLGPPLPPKRFANALAASSSMNSTERTTVNAVMIAIELRRLVPVAIKPFSHRGHLTREIRRRQPNLHDLHEFASQAIELHRQNVRRTC